MDFEFEMLAAVSQYFVGAADIVAEAGNFQDYWSVHVDLPHFVQEFVQADC